MSGDNEAPDKIYLVHDGDDIDDATWCQDRINETDTEYIRADLVATPPGTELVPEGTRSAMKSIVWAYSEYLQGQKTHEELHDAMGHLSAFLNDTTPKEA